MKACASQQASAANASQLVVAVEQGPGGQAHAGPAGLHDQRLRRALAEPGDHGRRQRGAGRDLIAAGGEADVVELVELGRLQRELPIAVRRRNLRAAARRAPAQQEPRAARAGVHRDDREIAQPEPVAGVLISRLAGDQHHRAADALGELALDRGVDAPGSPC